MTSETMTLAFELAALQQTREPQAVVVDARRWAQSVGLVSMDSEAAHSFSAEHLIRRDFQVKPTLSNLRHLRSQFSTERHVLIGDASREPGYLPHQWEYLKLADAADAADWDLETAETTSQTKSTPWLNRILRIQE